MRLTLLRVGVPGLIALVGAVLIAAGHERARNVGVALVAVSVVVVLANAFIRIGISSERDRDREEAAREYYDRHGRWPDER